MSEKRWGLKLIGPHPPLWWRPRGRGYTPDISEAGLFDAEEAARQDGPRWEGCSSPRDEAVSPSDMLKMVHKEVETIQERLERLTALVENLGEVAPLIQKRVEDRSKPPEGLYEVELVCRDSDGKRIEPSEAAADELAETRWVARALLTPTTGKRDAVAGCWAHHDAHPAIAELENLRRRIRETEELAERDAHRESNGMQERAAKEGSS